MPTAISEAVYHANTRLPGFDDQVFSPMVARLCEQSKEYSHRMNLALPIMMETGWRGTIHPNKEALLGGVASVYLLLLDEKRALGLNGLATQHALLDLLRMSDDRIRNKLYEIHDTGKKFKIKRSTNPPKEKIDPWKRHFGILVAAFAHWMATESIDNRYWALTTKSYSPEDYKDQKEIESIPSSLIKFFIGMGEKTTETTFVPLNFQPKIAFTSTGLLVNTWD